VRRATVGLGLVGLLLGGGSGAQTATNPYPNMAPLAQYLSPSQEAEIALARSAAPPSISAEAEILAFGPKGYETAVKGKNHFVCIVERAWSNNYDKPDFWNPTVRQPHCFNQAAARSVLPAYLKRTEWVHGGAVPLGDVESHQGCGSQRTNSARVGLDGLYDVQGHLSGRRRRPLLPRTSADEWGADLKGSPVFSDCTFLEPLTIFFVPVTRWSDGTLADVSSHTAKAGATAAKR